ncbi:MAG: hypothetical protein KIG38_07360 [Bacteroidales bacterium]|nr:hypothetical protein [Bacteroidales bacterium]
MVTENSKGTRSASAKKRTAAVRTSRGGKPAAAKNGIPKHAQAGSRMRKPAGDRKRKPASRRRDKRIALPWWTVATAAAAILVGISIALTVPSSGERGAAVPRDMPGDLGIDLSHHNGKNIVWDSLRVMTDRNGLTVKKMEDAVKIRKVAFAFIKASEGESMKDRCFRDNWDNALEYGIARGAYHFYRSSKDPVRQAENFIDAVGELRYSDLPPVLDVETVHKGCSREELRRGVRIWLETVEARYGRKPVIYSGQDFAQEWLGDGLLEDYPLWIARYGDKKPVRDDWEWWQFTDRAIVSGIRGRVDLSIKRSSTSSSR